MSKLYLLESSLPHRIPTEHEFPAEQSPTSIVLETGQPFYFPDLESETRFPVLMQMLRESGIRSYCALPLFTERRKIGSLTFGSPEKDAYGGDEIGFMGQVARQVAVAVENALNFEAATALTEDLARERDRLRLLLQVNNAVVAQLETRPLFEAIFGSLRQALDRSSWTLQGVDLQRLAVAGQIGQAEAAHAAAKARLEMALSGARVQEVRQAEKALEQASAAYETADATYQRFRGLFKEGVISEQAENEIKLRYLSAKAQKEGAEARLDMVREGTRKEEIEQARQGLAAAEAALKLARDGALQVPIREQEAAAALHQAEAVKGQLEEARAYQSETLILSPIDGYVSERIATAGETVAAGAPILTLVGRSDFKVKVYADESKFGYLQLERPVRIVLPALAGAQLNGKIIRISQSADFATKKATNEQNSFDVRALQIVVGITDKDSRLRNGMTARVKLAPVPVAAPGSASGLAADIGTLGILGSATANRGLE